MLAVAKIALRWLGLVVLFTAVIVGCLALVVLAARGGCGP